MKKILFVVNSLQNGGAERVVVSQANYFAEKGQYQPIIICFRKWCQYKVDKRVRIIYLTKKKNFSRPEKFLIPHILKRRMDGVISDIGAKNIEMATAHLPLAHIVCRSSKYKNMFLYVMHNPQFQFKHSNAIGYEQFLKYMYNDMKVIAVSNGVRDELIDRYKIKPSHIETIYNPLDCKKIDTSIKAVHKNLD